MLRVVSREDIAEVTGRDDVLDLERRVCDLPLDVEIREEIVNSLGEDARPVDRVDRTEPVGRVELSVAEERLDDVLCSDG